MILRLFITSLFIGNLFADTIFEDPKWLNLYRYERIGDHFKSQVTNAQWFFSKQGPTSPDQELIAALKEFKDKPQLRCQFPARASFLQSKGLLAEIKLNCPKLEYMKKKLNLRHVSLVFASAHVNNPSSAFGHTFFKLKGSDQFNDFLNWGFNFSAKQTTKNPLLYGIYGFTGGFKANFSLLPYFIKLKEYQDFENRDLWEYQLNLTQNQLDFFVEHLIEMSHAEFDYYYLTQNCSYHLFAFLDAVNPEWELKKSLPYFVIPGETTRSLIESNQQLVSKISFKPSPFKKLKKAFSLLSSQEKTQVKKVKEENTAIENLSTPSLDFLIDYLDYSAAAGEKNSNSLKGLKRDLLIKRSKRTEKQSAGLPSKPQAPHQRPRPSTLSMGLRRDLFKNYQTKIEYRASHSELIDPNSDLRSWSQLVFGRASAYFHHEDKDFRIENLTLINIQANTQKLFSKLAPSWGIDLSLKDRLYTRDYDLGPSFEFHYGYNFQMNNTLFRLILPLTLHYSKRPALEQRVRSKKVSIDSKLTAEIFQRLGSKLTLKISGALWYNSIIKEQLNSTSQLQLRWSIFDPLVLDIGGGYRLNEWESDINLIGYF